MHFAHLRTYELALQRTAALLALQGTAALLALQRTAALLALQRTAALLGCLFDWTIGLDRDIRIGKIGGEEACKPLALFVEKTDSQRIDCHFLDSPEVVKFFLNLLPPLKSAGGGGTYELPSGFFLIFFKVDY